MIWAKVPIRRSSSHGDGNEEVKGLGALGTHPCVINEVRFHRVEFHLDLALGFDQRIAVSGELGDDRFAPARR
jgi:hypothetical protein